MEKGLRFIFMKMARSFETFPGTRRTTQPSSPISDIIKRLPNCLSKEVKSTVVDCEFGMDMEKK